MGVSGVTTGSDAFVFLKWKFFPPATVKGLLLKVLCQPGLAIKAGLANGPVPRCRIDEHHFGFGRIC